METGNHLLEMRFCYPFYLSWDEIDRNSLVCREETCVCNMCLHIYLNRMVT